MNATQIPDLSFLDDQPERTRAVPEAPPVVPDDPPADWNRDEAIRLMTEADELPSRLGVSGTHPDIQRAAAMLVSAFQTRDIETVRFAVAEFAVEVRRVAGRSRPVV